MKVLVIEDEPLATEKIAELIHLYDKGTAIAASLPSVERTIAWFRKNKSPDLVFADIELLDGNVFEVFEAVDVGCPVIFTTAYDQFWMQAFELNGISYLLKPVSSEKFELAMKKFEKLRAGFKSFPDDFWHEVRENLIQPSFKDRLVVKVRGGVKILETSDVMFFRIQDEIPFAFCATGDKFALKENLATLERVLDPQVFFRLNRGEIVNIKFIENLKPYFGDRLIVRLRNSKIDLVCSRNRTPNLRKWIEGDPI